MQVKVSVLSSGACEEWEMFCMKVFVYISLWQSFGSSGCLHDHRMQSNLRADSSTS